MTAGNLFGEFPLSLTQVATVYRVNS